MLYPLPTAQTPPLSRHTDVGRLSTGFHWSRSRDRRAGRSQSERWWTSLYYSGAAGLLWVPQSACAWSGDRISRLLHRNSAQEWPLVLLITSISYCCLISPHWGALHLQSGPRLRKPPVSSSPPPWVYNLEYSLWPPFRRLSQTPSMLAFFLFDLAWCIFSNPPPEMAAQRAVSPTPSTPPLSPVPCHVLYLWVRRRDVGAHLALAAGEMAPYLPTGAFIGLAGQNVPTFAESVGQKTPRAVPSGCSPQLICLVLLPLALPLIVNVIGCRLGGVRDNSVFSQFVGRFRGWWGMGPQLNLAFLSTSQVCLVMDRTHAPIFSPFSIWSVGFGKDVEALYSPEGRVLLLIFMINIQFQ